MSYFLYIVCPRPLLQKNYTVFSVEEEELNEKNIELVKRISFFFLFPSHS